METRMRSLVQEILQDYSLPRNGIHGVSHWARVLENGGRLASLTGARQHVVQLFSVLHDSKRDNDGIDFRHGPLGARYAQALNGVFYRLDDEDLDLLVMACRDHTLGLTAADITVQTCWDADRLDLARVGINPEPARLCTPAAREAAIIEWANTRSRARAIPSVVRDQWGIDLEEDGAP